MASITIDRATRFFDEGNAPAVDSLDLDIADGEFLVLVGPSGCGKSTSLRMLAGLEEVDSGSIMIGGHDVTHVQPKDRDIAMVFQNYALYPHMTVAENMGFALKLAGTPRGEIARRVDDAAQMLDLGDFLTRKPKALSGGQRQRVAMGRAIIRQPQVFLMDEPLSNLDAKLRVATRTQIAALQRRLGITTVYVTHDQTEAMTMGDRVAVMKGGVLQQCASPRELYRSPANAFVAGFMGSPAMNLLRVGVSKGIVAFGDDRVELTRSIADAAGTEALLGIRPEHLEFAPTGVPMIVDVVEELGAEAYVFGRAEIGGAMTDLVVRAHWHNPPERGSKVFVRALTDHVHVFSVADDGVRFADVRVTT